MLRENLIFRTPQSAGISYNCKSFHEIATNCRNTCTSAQLSYLQENVL